MDVDTQCRQQIEDAITKYDNDGENQGCLVTDWIVLYAAVNGETTADGDDVTRYGFLVSDSPSHTIQGLAKLGMRGYRKAARII
jgi:hypothetical protein